MDNYIIYTSAYNEEENIEKTIKSITKQSILPDQWLIVNDGSSDKTEQIIKLHAEKHHFITLINKDKSKVDPGAHVGINWKIAKSYISNNDWNFIAQLDADIEIDRIDFYEGQINFLNQNQDVGISSGITYSYIKGKKILTDRPYWRTGGASKVYKRKCFDEIGEIYPIFAWDGLDVYKAMYNGWKSRTLFDSHVNHLGKERMIEREKGMELAFIHGKNLYMRGFPFEFILLKSLVFFSRSFKQFYCFVKGYKTAVREKKVFVNNNEKKFIRKIQYLRVIDKFYNKKLL